MALLSQNFESLTYIWFRILAYQGACHLTGLKMYIVSYLECAMYITGKIFTLRKYVIMVKFTEYYPRQK